MTLDELKRVAEAAKVPAGDRDNPISFASDQREFQYTFTPELCAALVDYIATDMRGTDNEFRAAGDRLCTLLEGGGDGAGA